MAAAVAGVVIAVGVPSSGAIERAAPIRWHLVAQARAIQPLFGTAIACATATDCTALGSGIQESAAYSADGGKSWHKAVDPVGNAFITEVTCPTRSWCEAWQSPIFGSAVIIGSSDAGRVWLHQYGSSDQDGFLTALACSPQGTCLGVVTATGGAQSLLRSSNEGRTWTTIPFAVAGVSLTDVSCPTAVDCEGVGVASTRRPWFALSTDGGSTWTPQSTVGAPSVRSWGGVVGFDDAPVQVQCPTTTSCLVLDGTAAVRSSDGGSTWTTTKPSSLHGLSDWPKLSCASDGRCLAEFAGGVLAATDDLGATWRPVSRPPTNFDVGSIDCTPTRCLALGESNRIPGEGFLGFNFDSVTQVLSVGRDSLQVWSTLDGGAVITSTDCTSATRCVVVGDLETPWGPRAAVLDTGAGSVRWQLVTALGPASEMTAIDCPTASTCVATAATGTATQSDRAALLRSDDGGRRWQIVDLLGTRDVTGGQLACALPASCAAIAGAAIAWTNDGGATWSLVHPRKALSLGALSCAPGNCVLLGTGGTGEWRSTDGGRTWREVSDPGAWSHSDTVGVTCPTASTCVAEGLVGTSVVGARSDDGGLHWSTSPFSWFEGTVNGIGCRSAAWCLLAFGFAVQTTGMLRSVNGGRTWAQFPVPPGMANVNQLTCGRWGCSASTSTLTSGRSGAWVLEPAR